MQPYDNKWGYDREAHHRWLQAISELEAERRRAYDDALDTEAAIQANPEDRTQLIAELDRHYIRATEIEAEIDRVRSVGLNPTMEDED